MVDDLTMVITSVIIISSIGLLLLLAGSWHLLRGLQDQPQISNQPVSLFHSLFFCVGKEYASHQKFRVQLYEHIKSDV